MLLEAGFIDAGLARLEDAIAIAPNRVNARWELARAWALEGDWDSCEHLARQLAAAGSDRWVLRMRFAAWRRDVDALEKCAAEPLPYGGMPRLITTVLRTALDGAWFERRDAVIAKMIGASSASARRIQFDAQLIA